MKGKIFKITLFILLFSIVGNVKAATGSLGISANVNSAKVGQTVTVSIYAKGLTGSFNVTSSDSSVLSGGCSNEWYENNTYTCTFTAKSVGNATITVSSIAVNHNDDYSEFNGSKSTSVKVINEETKTYNYSNNNSSSNNKTNNSNNNSTNNTKKDLSSVNTLNDLSVEGYKLDKDFNKDTTEYNIEVPNDITKVNVKASASDDKASIDGIGEREVSEGNNKLEIKVTAENGNVKTYIINVNVKELDPINVKIDNDEYTIVRKEEGLEIPESFEKTTVKIDDQDVLAFKNDILGYTLVALKDKDGNTKFYVYDNGKYSEFIVLEVNGLKVILLDYPKDKIIKNYKLSEFEVNEKKYKGYTSNKKSSFYLIYAKNYKTGKDYLYQYDSEEGTLQRYNTDKINVNNTKTESYKLPFIIATVIAILVTIAYIITIIFMKKKGNNKLKYSKSKRSIN